MQSSGEIVERCGLVKRNLFFLEHVKSSFTLGSAVSIAEVGPAVVILVTVTSQVRERGWPNKLARATRGIDVHICESRSRHHWSGALNLNGTVFFIVVNRARNPPLPFERTLW